MENVDSYLMWLITSSVFGQVLGIRLLQRSVQRSKRNVRKSFNESVICEWLATSDNVIKMRRHIGEVWQE